MLVTINLKIVSIGYEVRASIIMSLVQAYNLSYGHDISFKIGPPENIHFLMKVNILARWMDLLVEDYSQNVTLVHPQIVGTNGLAGLNHQIFLNCLKIKLSN